jgi:hypothetical protein
MGSKHYLDIKQDTLQGDFDWVVDEIRIILVMSNSTVEIEDPSFISGFTTLDEFDGSGNSRFTLITHTITRDDIHNKAYFAAGAETNIFWSALGPGTRKALGVLFYKFVTDDTDSIPIAFFKFKQLLTPGGGPFTVEFPSNWLIYA